MFDRFDDHALAAVQAAQAEAIGIGHNYLGTEHLLLGIVVNPDTVAAHLLAALAHGLRRFHQLAPARLCPFDFRLPTALDHVHRRAEPARSTPLRPRFLTEKRVGEMHVLRAGPSGRPCTAR